jgi:WD40 repeat protein
MDRKLIATGSRDQTIRVWEPDTGMPVSLYSGFMERITCCTFLPGKPLLIAGYNNGLITFVDAVTGKSLSTWRVLDTPVTTLACSADGRIIAAGYESGVITIWSGEGSSLRFSRSGHRGAVHALSFSPDGGALFSGGEDHVLRVWDTATGIPGREYPGHTAPVRACAVSPDNSFVVSGSDDATAVIWGREENIALSVLYYSFALTHVQWIPGTPPVLVVIDCKGRTFHYQSGLENICYNIDNFMVNYNDKQAERDNP